MLTSLGDVRRDFSHDGGVRKVHRVIYTSRASRLFSPQGIEGLSVTCRRKNAEAGLTGLLLYHEGQFFQVLEGEEEPLLTTMKRVIKDRRHESLKLLEHGAIAQRAFTGWHMGCEIPAGMSYIARAVFPLPDLLPPDSPYRGRDPAVRHRVRRFLSSLRALPRAAVG